MTKEYSLKEYVAKVVNESTGIKGTDLAVELALMKNPLNEEFISALAELVNEGEIIEIEYVLPQMNYRVKSIYFPKRTSLTILKGGPKSMGKDPDGNDNLL